MDKATDTHGIGFWVARQRARYFRGELTQAEIRAFESQPGWVWSVLVDRWDTYYSELVAYTAANGKLPPQSHSLGNWITDQREDYNKEKISTVRKARLEEITLWSWAPHNDTWRQAYEAVKNYVDSEGKYPSQASGYLGTWVCTQRNDFRDGRMPKERKNLLEALARWSWNTKKDSWRLSYNELVEYVEVNGTLPPLKTPLGTWVSRQRKAFKSNSLSLEEKTLLELVPTWSWDAKNDNWNSTYRALLLLMDDQEALPIQPSPLGGWIARQRQAFRNGKLLQERATLLEKIPAWKWDSDSWQENYDALLAFVKANDCSPPQTSGFSLGVWASRQRLEFKKGNLSPEKARLLEAVPHWSWAPHRDLWGQRYRQLVEYVQTNSCLPPAHPTALGAWVVNQRALFRGRKLSEDRISLLNRVPAWSWDENKDFWQASYQDLLSFVNIHGKVPAQDDSRLGTWVGGQRESFRKQRLRADRILLLEKVEGWNWDPYDSAWLSSFESLAGHIAAGGKIPGKGTGSLGNWVYRQRRSFKSGSQSDSRIQLLETLLGWKW